MIAQTTGKPKPTQHADLAVREHLAVAIHNSSKSRELIADEMSALVGRTITVRMINDYTATAESKRAARFPAAWIESFCQVTGNETLQRSILSPRLRMLLDLAECQLAEAAHSRRAAELIGGLLTDADVQSSTEK